MTYDLQSQEVFLVADPTFSGEPTEVFVTDNRMELDEFLMSKDPSVDETSVFHGIITKAVSLPSSLKGRSCYIVVLPEEADADNMGIIIEGGDTVDELAKEIETLITAAPTEHFGQLSIDDIYVLYGYQLGLGIAIIEDDIDEEYIFTCDLIADEAVAVNEGREFDAETS